MLREPNAPASRGKKGKRGRPAGSMNGYANLMKVVEDQHQRSKEAARLVPRWQKLVDRESELRRESAKLERKLEATSKKAGKLKSKIVRLMGTSTHG